MLFPGTQIPFKSWCATPWALFPEAPAILLLRSALIFRSDLIFALAGKCKNKIGSKNGSDLEIRSLEPQGFLPNIRPRKPKLGGRFGYFFYFLLGEREGGVRGRREGGGGSIFFFEIPEGEGFSRRGEGPRGLGEGVYGRIGGRGRATHICFWGRNVHQKMH